MMLEKLRELEAEKGFDDINIIRGTGTRTFMDEWVATDLLGRGSFGNVYRIVKPQRGVSAQECALKICEFSTPEDGEFKRQEIETQKLLAGHPNAVQIEDYSLLHRAPPRVSYLLIRMELLNRLPEEGLSEHETIRLGIDICSVLEKCASLEPKLIHCDIKPANILVSNDGRYKLGDFGTAKTLGATMTYTGNRGTPLYMAPEVASFSGYDSRCDIFSLGYTMLTMLNGGRHPYEDAGDVAEILRCMYGSRKLPQINGVSPGLMKILRKMCEPSLQQRYSRASEVRRDLERFVRKKEETIRNNRLEAERQSELAVRKTKAELEKNMKAAKKAEAKTDMDADAARTAKGKATLKERARIQKNIERLEARIEQIHSARRYVQEGATYKDAMRLVKENGCTGKKRGSWGIALIALAVVVALTAGVLALTLRPDSKPDTPVRVETTGLMPHEERVKYEAGADGSFTIESGVNIAPSIDRKGYIITGYENFFSGKNIPSEYEGLPVVGVAPEAFKACSLKKITIPDSIEYIGDQAFADCAELQSVNIPKNVKYIGSNPFCSCPALKDVDLDAENHSFVYINKMLFSGDLTRFISSQTNDSVLNVPDGIVSIDAHAFREMQFSSVYIPNSVLNIGASAFENCLRLTDVRLPGSLELISESLFRGCFNLSSIEMPRIAKTIDDYAFADCANLTEVTLPGNLYRIGYSAFANCEKLNRIEVPGSVNEIKDAIFSGCVNLREVQVSGANVRFISNSMFEGCTSLSEITLPERIVEIGEKAFFGCENLKKIDVPDTLESIRKNAFGDCVSLESISIPERVKNMDDGAFSNCRSLSKMNVPGSVNNPGEQLFYGCSGLVRVVLSDGVQQINHRMFQNCTALESVTIPDSVTSIKEYAFSGCDSISYITVPESVNNISIGAFFGCIGLKEFNIPSCVEDVSFCLFSGCTGLERVSLPDGIISIASNAFEDCTQLTHITIPPSVEIIGQLAFPNCVNLTVTAPHDAGYYHCTNPGDYIEWIVDPNL